MRSQKDQLLARYLEMSHPEEPNFDSLEHFKARCGDAQKKSILSAVNRRYAFSKAGENAINNQKYSTALANSRLLKSHKQ